MGFIQDLQIIATISKIFGTNPFFLVRESTGEAVLKKKGWIYSTVVVSFLEGLSFYFFYDILKNTRLYSGLSTTDESNSLNQLFEVILSIFSYCGVLLMCLRNYNKNVETLNGLVQIDKEITQNFRTNLKVDNTKLTSTFFVLSALAVALIFNYVSVKGFATQNQQIMLWCFLLQFIISTTFTMNHSSVIRVVLLRLEFVNNTTNDIIQNPNATSNVHKLRLLFVLYYKLRNVCENVNEGTGIGLLLYMAYMFYTVTNQSYVIFVTSRATMDDRIKLYLITLSVIWIIIHIILVGILSLYCGNTSGENVPELSFCLLNICNCSSVLFSLNEFLQRNPIVSRWSTPSL